MKDKHYKISFENCLDHNFCRVAGMKPRVKNHYRAHQLSVWLRLVPELHRAGMEDVVARHNLFRDHEDPRLYDGVVRPNPLLARLQDTRSRGNLTVAEVVLSLTTETPPLTTCMTVHLATRHQNTSSETITHLEAAGMIRLLVL